MAHDDKELLDILQGHGQRFLKSFALPVPGYNHRKRKRSEEGPSHTTSKIADEGDDSNEEWSGIGSSQLEADIALPSEGLGQDDGFYFDTSSHSPNVVVFSDSSSLKSTSSTLPTTAQMKAFMSSKVSNLTRHIPGVLELDEPELDKDDERTNAQNDTLLHRLVHTKLLSGSLNPELDLTPAHRRKALAGRVLELSGEAKLGNGEKAIREAERNKAAKRVRKGILEKQKERGKQQLEQAKNLGNYHPTIKKLFETSSTSRPAVKRRDRGLTMGVGRFTRGTLKLSRDDISRAQGDGRGRREGRKGSRGGRGRGRGRTK